jgi:BMFP domain-containing protein YqiC
MGSLGTKSTTPIIAPGFQPDRAALAVDSIHQASIAKEATMLDRKFFDEINAKISEVIAASPAKDIEKNMKAMMMAMFSKMDLVTRDEFDVQVQVLQKTREKVDALEAKLLQQEAEKISGHEL